MSGVMERRVRNYGMAVLGLAIIVFVAYWIAHVPGRGVDGLADSSINGGDQEKVVDTDGADAELMTSRAVDFPKRESGSEVGGSEQSHSRTVIAGRSLASSQELQIRLFLGQGNPLKHGSVQVEYVVTRPQSMGKGVSRVTQFGCDSQLMVLSGSNTLRIRVHGLSDVSSNIWVKASHVTSKPGRSGQRWGHSMIVPGPTEGREWIAPDFVLQTEEQQLLCKGTVLDRAGQPIKECKILWGLRPRSWGGQSSSMGTSAPPLATMVSSRGDAWQETSSTLEPEADGSFEIWGRSRPVIPFFYLTVGAPGFLPVEGKRVARGTADLRTVLERSGSLEGTLLLPDGADMTCLRIALLGEASMREKAEALATPKLMCQPQWKNGLISFQLGLVPAGRYELHVGYLSPHQTLIKIPGVEIHAGQDSRDLRVQNLDLRTLIKRICVSVRSAGGASLLSASIRYSVHNPITGLVKGGAGVDAYGRAYLTIPSSGVELRVSSRGLQPLQIKDVKRDLTVRLQLDMRPKVEVLLGGGLPGYARGKIRMELEAVISPPKPRTKARPEKPERLTSRSYSLTGRFYFGRVTPGPYRVRVLVSTASHGREHFPVEGDPIFHVVKGSQKKVIRVVIDQNRLAEMFQAAEDHLKKILRERKRSEPAPGAGR